MKKRMFLFLLSMCMLLLLSSIGVLADETDPISRPEARYQTEENGEWVSGSLADACQKVYKGGKVELLQDVNLNSAITVTKELTLTSSDTKNPCTITYQAKKRGEYLLTVKSAAVTMENIILDGGWKKGYTSKAELAAVQNGGQMTMGAGSVLQNNNNVDTSLGAGGLRVISGTATMKKGSVIRNCQALGGGGAAVAGSNAGLFLNGGNIEDCQAILGGGVFIQEGGALHVNDGSIYNNKAKKEIEGLVYKFSDSPGKGGGIYVASGYVYMFGGTVAKNTTEASGGGIGVNAGLIQLAGGTVRQNSAQFYGGGIVASPKTNILVGNNPVVMDNVSGQGYFHNLYLDGVEDDYPSYATRPMTIGAALRDNTCIGVSRWTRPNEEHPYRIVAVPAANYTITEDDLAKFTSDDPAYVVLLIDGNIVLTTKPPHTHAWAKEWSKDANSHWHVCTADACPITENSQKDGYASHIEDKGTVTRAPTAEMAGVRTYRCTVCQYVIRTEEIPVESAIPEASEDPVSKIPFKPAASKNSSKRTASKHLSKPAPQTGDDNLICTYSGLLVLTVIAGGVFVAYYFKKKNC